MKKQAPQSDDDGSKFMDRISDLPQTILQRILSFLSQKEAVQTCVLSKSWRYFWCTLPKIEFRECFLKGNKQTFLSVVDETLQRYHDQNHSIQEFIFEMSMLDDKSNSLLQKWIPIVIQDMCVRTFNLCFLSKTSAYLVMSSVVFKAKSLRKLYLKGCRLLLSPVDSNDNVLWGHLQTLSLKRVYISDETFEKIMSSCPLIEYVTLHRCEGLRFVFHLNKNYFSNLKSLSLGCMTLYKELFDSFSTNFPCLEELSFLDCYGFEELQLSSRSIKNLTVDVDRSIKVVVDATNILYFKLSANAFLPSISFTTTSSHFKSDIHLCLSLLNLDNGCPCSSWLRKLSEVFIALRQSEIVLYLDKNHIYNRQSLEEDINYDDLYNTPLAVVEHLRLGLTYHSLSSLSALINGLFRICRPRCISGFWFHFAERERKAKQLTEFMCKTFLTERDKRTSFGNKICRK